MMSANCTSDFDTSENEIFTGAAFRDPREVEQTKMLREIIMAKEHGGDCSFQESVAAEQSYVTCQTNFTTHDSQLSGETTRMISAQTHLTSSSSNGTDVDLSSDYDGDVSRNDGKGVKEGAPMSQSFQEETPAEASESDQSVDMNNTYDEMMLFMKYGPEYDNREVRHKINALRAQGIEVDPLQFYQPKDATVSSNESRSSMRSRSPRDSPEVPVLDTEAATVFHREKDDYPEMRPTVKPEDRESGICGDSSSCDGLEVPSNLTQSESFGHYGDGDFSPAGKYVTSVKEENRFSVKEQQPCWLREESTLGDQQASSGKEQPFMKKLQSTLERDDSIVGDHQSSMAKLLSYTDEGNWLTDDGESRSKSQPSFHCDAVSPPSSPYEDHPEEKGATGSDKENEVAADSRSYYQDLPQIYLSPRRIPSQEISSSTESLDKMKHMGKEETHKSKLPNNANVGATSLSPFKTPLPKSGALAQKGIPELKLTPRPSSKILNRSPSFNRKPLSSQNSPGKAKIPAYLHNVVSPVASYIKGGPPPMIVRGNKGFLRSKGDYKPPIPYTNFPKEEEQEDCVQAPKLNVIVPVERSPSKPQPGSKLHFLTHKEGPQVYKYIGRTRGHLGDILADTKGTTNIPFDPQMIDTTVDVSVLQELKD